MGDRQFFAVIAGTLGVVCDGVAHFARSGHSHLCRPTVHGELVGIFPFGFCPCDFGRVVSRRDALSDHLHSGRCDGGNHLLFFCRLADRVLIAGLDASSHAFRFMGAYRACGLWDFWAYPPGPHGPQCGGNLFVGMACSHGFGIPKRSTPDTRAQGRDFGVRLFLCVCQRHPNHDQFGPDTRVPHSFLRQHEQPCGQRFCDVDYLGGASSPFPIQA